MSSGVPLMVTTDGPWTKRNSSVLYFAAEYQEVSSAWSARARKNSVAQLAKRKERTGRRVMRLYMAFALQKVNRSEWVTEIIVAYCDTKIQRSWSWRQNRASPARLGQSKMMRTGKAMRRVGRRCLPVPHSGELSNPPNLETEGASIS